MAKKGRNPPPQNTYEDLSRMMAEMHADMIGLREDLNNMFDESRQQMRDLRVDMSGMRAGLDGLYCTISGQIQGLRADLHDYFSSGLHRRGGYETPAMIEIDSGVYEGPNQFSYRKQD